MEEIEHLAVGTRLGEGLSERGMLSEAAMRRTTVECGGKVRAQRARSHGASLVCIATSAMRRAENALVFTERLQAATGALKLRITRGRRRSRREFFLGLRMETMRATRGVSRCWISAEVARSSRWAAAECLSVPCRWRSARCG